MVTTIVTIRGDESDEAKITQAGEMLKEGKLVAFPTETVYGLGANALDAEAASKIYSAKGRPSDNPLIVHIADWDALGLIVSEIPTKARMLAEKFWPGPLTMIFPKSERVPYEITGGLDTVAVRMPGNETALRLIRAGGGYIAAPSANTSGRPSTTTAQHVKDDLDGKIDMIVDGGEVPIGLESTIVDLSGENPVILRPGYITQEMLEEVIGKVQMDEALIKEDSNIVPKAPGMKYRHYAPKADLLVVEGKQEDVVAKINELVREKADHGLTAGVICTEETEPYYEAEIVRVIGSREDEASIARNLFAILREFDDLDADGIYSESFESPGLGQAIMNRLLKAAGHQVLKVGRGGISKYSRLLFVSSGNTSVGPMAEGIARKKLEGRAVEILSRGLVVLFPEPVNQKAEAVMIRNGIRLDGHMSRRLAREDMGDGCLVLTIDKKQKEEIKKVYPEQSSVFTLEEYARSQPLSSPYGGELADYGRCFEQLEQMIDKVIRRMEWEGRL